MLEKQSTQIIREFHDFINDGSFPCVAARAAIAQENVPCFVAGHMGCPNDDAAIIHFIYDFVAEFRGMKSGFKSAAVLFNLPDKTTPEIFDRLLWQRLQALSDIDADNFNYDPRVNQQPSASDFSFSLGEEAFFIIGLHEGSSRPSRRFKYPALIFNPHAQFDELRRLDRYEKLKHIVRQRDVLYSGEVNPMLADFGEKSEAFQYSGRQYKEDWICPFKHKHGEFNDHPPEK